MVLLQLDALTRQLAMAHAPLALLALGLTLDTQPPQARQVSRAKVARIASLSCLHG